MRQAEFCMESGKLLFVESGILGFGIWNTCQRIWNPTKDRNSDFARFYCKISTMGEGEGSYFPYILLNEIQTMFSQLAKRSARVVPADLCTDHVHYVKKPRSTVLRKNKNMAVEGGTVSHCYILVIRNL